MLVAEAFVSGSLGQAVYRRDGTVRVLDSPTAEARAAAPNELLWFHKAAREVVLVEPDGSPIEVERVRDRLETEILFFRGLDGLLVGMDADFPFRLRQRAVMRAEAVLKAEDAVARQVRERFLVPANTQEWDPSGAVVIAADSGADAAGQCYRQLAEGAVDRLADDINAGLLDKVGSGVDLASKRAAIFRSGLIAELALIEERGDLKALAALNFRRDDFPRLRDVDPSGQILLAVVRHVEDRIRQISAGVAGDRDPARADAEYNDARPDPPDPIWDAVEKAIEVMGRRAHNAIPDGEERLRSIQREIDWIAGELNAGRIERAEHSLIQLIEYQGQHSRAEDLVKTLTAVADHARNAGHFDWLWRPLDAIDITGGRDATAMAVRAETLRDLGRHADALAALDDTIERFPHNEVARTARAGTLRDLGRHADALAALDDTIERFPHNVVARTARAGTLRDLGRHADALAALDDTIERFPHNVVARTARAETLRDLGRHADALAALDDTIERFPHDVVARNARAETLRDLGRHADALAVLDDMIERFPHNEVARTARAGTLRDLGRHADALAALDDTIERFPHDVVARTARAETLRDLGRHADALAALDDTIERFPHNKVARNASCHLLAQMGAFARAEAILAPAAERAETRSEWIAKHILGLARLRAGQIAQVLDDFELGARFCPFRDVRAYFDTALPLVLLADQRASEAARRFEALAELQTLPRREMANVVLFQVHALAEAEEANRAKILVNDARIIDFAADQQKRLAAALNQRYGLASGIPASPVLARELDDVIVTLEFDLVCPWRAGVRARAA